MAPTSPRHDHPRPDFFDLDPHRTCEEESTQTDHDTSFHSEVWNSDGVDDSDIETGSSDSVMSRITRQVGRFFSADDNRHDRGTQTAKDPVASETERLAYDVVFYSLGRRPMNSGDEVAMCLRRCVQKMLDKHEIVFNGMMTRLRITRDCDLKQGFCEIAEELFFQNEVSWAKIVALYTFGARLAQHCQENDMENLVYDIATNLSQFAVEKITPFVKSHGGWVGGFYDYEKV